MSKKVEPVTRSDEFLAYQIDRLVEEHRKTQELLITALEVLMPKPVEEEKPKHTVKTSVKEVVKEAFKEATKPKGMLDKAIEDSSKGE